MLKAAISPPSSQAAVCGGVGADLVAALGEYKIRPYVVGLAVGATIWMLLNKLKGLLKQVPEMPMAKQVLQDCSAISPDMQVPVAIRPRSC